LGVHLLTAIVVVGLLHSVTTWPLLLLVHYLGFETFDAHSIPWPDLCAAVAFAAGNAAILAVRYRSTKQTCRRTVPTCMRPSVRPVSRVFGFDSRLCL